MNEEVEVGAMSLIFEFNKDVFAIENIEFLSEHDQNFQFNVVDEQILISWYNVDPVVLKSDEAVFNIKIRTADLNNVEITKLDLHILGNSEIADKDAMIIENVKFSTPGLSTSGDSEYYLSHNHPNPFNKTTEITYNIPEAGKVTLKVYNLLGEEISILLDENKEAGLYTVKYDGSELTPGVYVYTIEVAGTNSSFMQSRMMILSD